MNKWEILKQVREPQDRLAPPKPGDEVSFGKFHSNHMFVCDFIHAEGGWQQPKIIPYANFSFAPDSLVFHYGQQIFEGLKAFRLKDSQQIAIFRPDMNARRFYHSAERMGMEPVPIELFLSAITELVRVDQEFALSLPYSLYIRPCLIPLDTGVSYRASLDYRFFVILCPVKQYFGAHTTVTVLVEQEMVRAVRGGTGDTKAGANYASSVLALRKARQLGADSVLWLDALERRYVEEIGAMNIMFVYEDRIITPPLTGTILPGVTRDSLITLGSHLGYKIYQERIDIHQIISDAKTGLLKEAFGCGTAAVVSPIGSFIFGEERIKIGDNQLGPIARHLKETLQAIQQGQAEDIFSWRVLI